MSHYVWRESLGISQLSNGTPLFSGFDTPKLWFVFHLFPRLHPDLPRKHTPGMKNLDVFDGQADCALLAAESSSEDVVSRVEGAGKLLARSAFRSPCCRAGLTRGRSIGIGKDELPRLPCTSLLESRFAAPLLWYCTAARRTHRPRPPAHPPQFSGINAGAANQDHSRRLVPVAAEGRASPGNDPGRAHASRSRRRQRQEQQQQKAW